MKIVIDNYLPRANQRVKQGKSWNGKTVWYSPSKNSQQSLADVLRYYANVHGFSQFNEDVNVRMICFAKKAMRGDIDNYEKFVFDALQKSGIVKNDKQIRGDRSLLFVGLHEKTMLEIKPLFDGLTLEEKVLMLSQQGLSLREIARKCHCSKDTVHRRLRSSQF